MLLRTSDPIESLLENIPNADSALALRLQWAAAFFQYLLSRRRGRIRDQEFLSKYPKPTAAQWCIHLLESNSLWKERVRQVLSSLEHETSAYDLLAHGGLHMELSLMSELLERVQKKFLPQPHDNRNLVYFFSECFKLQENALILMKMDNTSFAYFLELFKGYNSDFGVRWKKDLHHALLFLALQIGSYGTRSELRFDVIEDLNQNVFVKLVNEVTIMVRSESISNDFERFNLVREVIGQCRNHLHEVRNNMEEYGVSINLVYQIDRLHQLLNRMEVLLLTGSEATFSIMTLKAFMASLVHDMVRSQSLLAFVDDNTSMIAKKITDVSAQTGEHYIAHNADERKKLFRASLGGGFVTAFTCTVKVLLSSMPAPLFIGGFFASLNYAVSFVFIHFFGFALATKQPAMTAAALANNLKRNSEDYESYDVTEAAKEVQVLLRSQVLSVMGNLAMVIPTGILVFLLLNQLLGSSILTDEKAVQILKELSFVSATPWYAMWTGILLFLSSLTAGWFHQWFLFRRLPQAFSQSPFWNRILGPLKATQFALFLKRNIAALAANISLGFFLGLSPVLGMFFGLPTDVRHVTLSTGSLVLASLHLGSIVFLSKTFWFAVMGIVVIGSLNIFVSFSLALLVAFRAKKVPVAFFLQILRFLGWKFYYYLRVKK